MQWQPLLVNTVFYIIAGFGCLIIGAFVLNKPPFDKPPGFAVRLLTYLTTNVAETRRDHRFPELELRCYPLAPAQLFARVEHAIEEGAARVVETHRAGRLDVAPKGLRIIPRPGGAHGTEIPTHDGPGERPGKIHGVLRLAGPGRDPPLGQRGRSVHACVHGAAGTGGMPGRADLQLGRG